MYKFSNHSKKHLDTLHKDLRKICEVAIKFHDFRVQEGYRSEEKQNRAFKAGASKLKYPQSKHNTQPSTAMDLLPFVNGSFIGWEDWKQWRYFGGFIIGIANTLYELGEIESQIRWGHDWNKDNNLGDHRFIDAPHFEII